MTHIMATKNEILYSVDDVYPAYPVHPGNMLGEELKVRGISSKKFSEMIGIQSSHLSALIHGARNFTPAVAAKIEKGLPEIPSSNWVKMQENYNKSIRQQKVNTSLLVSGYAPKKETLIPVLAEEGADYSRWKSVTIKIPKKDEKLLKELSNKFGWKM